MMNGYSTRILQDIRYWLRYRMLIVMKEMLILNKEKKHLFATKFCRPLVTRNIVSYYLCTKVEEFPIRGTLKYRTFSLLILRDTHKPSSSAHRSSQNKVTYKNNDDHLLHVSVLGVGPTIISFYRFNVLLLVVVYQRIPCQSFLLSAIVLWN